MTWNRSCNYVKKKNVNYFTLTHCSDLSFCFAGTPIFAQENRYLEQVGHIIPVVVRFVQYSNLVIEDIWIEVDGTGYIQTKTKDDLNISKKILRYTAFGNKGGSIIRYQISFETRILKLKHIIWAKHELGVDYYRFEIKELGKNYSTTKCPIKMCPFSSLPYRNN